MKRKNIFRISVAFFAMTAFTSCSDQFMQDKQNFDSTTADAYNYWSGALGRVADVYRVCLPDPKATPSSMYNSTGNLSRLKNIVDSVLLSIHSSR